MKPHAALDAFTGTNPAMKTSVTTPAHSGGGRNITSCLAESATTSGGTTTTALAAVAEG